MHSNSKNIIISAEHYRKIFGSDKSPQEIFSDFNLDIYQEDFTVIMGSSGAGKSTLMYSLSGMDKPTAGRITFCGTDITDLSSDKLAVFRRKNCGFVFQQVYLLDKMSLMDNVITAGTLTNKNRKEIVSRAKELFELVNIPEVTQKKMPSKISGGEAQRAGIVRAVINQPKVVFADEPTGALNSNNSQAVLDVLSKLHQNGQSIIMVTHDKKSALRGSRIIYLKDGQVLGECELGEYVSDTPERTQKLEEFLAQMGW